MTATAVNDTYVYLGRSGETLVAAGVSIITGAVGATAGTPTGIGGLYSSGTLTAYTTGQRTPIVTDATGNLRTLAVLIPSSARNITYGFGYSQQAQTGTTTQSIPGCVPFIDNGTSLDVQRKANILVRVASSAASGNPAFAKASAGDVTKFWGLNTQASVRYLQLYNKASAPVLGTDTPVLSFPINASERFSETIPNGGAYFPLGIAYAFTTDNATIPTTGAAAADIVGFALLAA